MFVILVFVCLLVFVVVGVVVLDIFFELVVIGLWGFGFECMFFIVLLVIDVGGLGRG